MRPSRFPSPPFVILGVAALSVSVSVAASVAELADPGAPSRLATVVGPALPACPSSATLGPGLTGPIAHVRYLADDALEGRAAGSPGERCAAEYVAARFREIGLAPAGENGTYFQSFPLRVGARLGPTNLLAVAAETYTAGRDWIPLGFSATANAEAPAAYAAYGITRPGNPDDVYSRTELTGKIVVVEAGDPGSSDGRSLYADPHFKTRTAEGRGALGLVVLLPDGSPLPEPESETRPSARIPAVTVRGALAGKLRAAAQAGERIRLHTEVEPRMESAHNVAGFLPAADPALRGRFVVIGAHLDHLGRGGEGSLAPDETGTIHNGADDNASGVAAIIEAARQLAGAPPSPRHSILFIAFSGEERGLLGSTHFVQHPTVTVDSVLAMLNLDMVGRLRENRLSVMGVGTAREWRDMLAAANARVATPFTLVLSEDGFGPSDHSSFYARGIPVLHFFTNAHEDYHRPSDDWQKLNADGLERVATLVTQVARDLGARSQLTAVAQAGDQHAGAGPAPESGYGPYLGTIPDFSPVPFGVRITGVRAGSPAEHAGLKAGDVIVAFGGKEIADLYAYTYALREKAPGDTVNIEVLRDSQRVRLTAVLGARR
ncbi:MAG: M20/M25/M40 family metallo-hydrolase [Gemmatimonadetes bacterium]|nr:M20/M25/M40 family metallo-hydrolase [Gemmatimonadota bacterium]